MWELLGALGGGIFRLMPLVFDLVKKAQENKHEITLLDKNIDLEKQRGINRTQEIQQMTAQGEQLAWANSLVEAVKNATPPIVEDKGNFWLNLLNGLNVSVRPILTYWWCIILYTANKVVLTVVAIQEKTPFKDMAPIIYTDFDRAIVGSIIGFWFVDRALRQQGK